jgi:tRNA (guanine26-N2/guanine27-N2)-dimethyltransferase
MKSSPPKLENAVTNLQKNNFVASVTSLSPTGFRTDAKINEIIKIFQTIQ